MLGEIASTMAESVLAAPCERILIPVSQDHFTIAGFETKPLGRLIDEAITLVKSRLDGIE